MTTTIAQIAEHVSRTAKTVRDLLKRAGVKMEKVEGGERGYRIAIADARKFVARFYPSSGAFDPTSKPAS